MADGVTEDPGNLDRLVDVVVLEPVSWWPPAPGWWVVLGLLLVALVVVLVRTILRWKRDAYRRAACAELDQIGEQVPVARVNEILKRTALCAWPREDIAPLCGEAWLRFLGRTGPVSEKAGRMLDLAYTSSVLGGAEGDALKESARGWIEGHRVQTEVEESKSQKVKKSTRPRDVRSGGLVALVFVSLVLAPISGRTPPAHSTDSTLSTFRLLDS